MLIQSGRFLYGRWNALLGEVAARTQGIHDAVCPFGFEVLRDEAFRAVVPRRFYVLARVEPDFQGDIDKQAWSYCDALVDAVAVRDPAFADSIVLKRVNGRRNVRLRGDAHRSSPTDRLLSVQVRRAPDSALDDYARYLVCALGGVARGTLGELARFPIDTRARRRFFQLAAMLECLVMRSRPILGERSLSYRVDQPEEFQQFYDGFTSTPPTKAELLHFDVAKNRLLAMLAAVRDVPGTSVRLITKDFYSEAQLSVDLEESIAAALLGEVVASFRDFVSADGT